MAKLVPFIILAAIATVIASCGVKGELRLPDDRQSEESAF